MQNEEYKLSIITQHVVFDIGGEMDSYPGIHEIVERISGMSNL